MWLQCGEKFAVLHVGVPATARLKYPDSRGVPKDHIEKCLRCSFLEHGATKVDEEANIEKL